jgi:sulfur transfer complex TusBCD TusB component (DsrH family)
VASNYKAIEAICPICGLSKSLNVPEVIFAQKKFGTIKIQVPTGAVCPEHQFIIFVDSKGIIRGYEKIDIQMAMPAAETELEKAGVLTLRKLIQLFGLYGIFSMIHSKVFNYPVYIIKDENFKYSEDVLHAIAEMLLPERYKGDKIVHFLEETNYGKIKLKEKNALLMDTDQHILQTPWDEKLKFEENMLKKALEIIDEEEQLVLMQQAIARLIKEAEYAKSVLEDVKEIYEDDLIEQLSRDLMMPKITHYRLSLIKNFIRQRFSSKLASKIKNKVEEFLDLL